MTQEILQIDITKFFKFFGVVFHTLEAAAMHGWFTVYLAKMISSCRKSIIKRELIHGPNTNPLNKLSMKSKNILSYTVTRAEFTLLFDTLSEISLLYLK